MNAKPWLFIDVDGVLNPNTSRSKAKKLGFEPHQITSWINGMKYRVFLNPSHGQWFMRLTNVNLAWATTWEEEANDLISYHLKILPLPVARMAQDFHNVETKKGPGILELANGAPFAWIDDEIGDNTSYYLNPVNPRHFLVKPDSSVGLTYPEFSAAKTWLDSINE